LWKFSTMVKLVRMSETALAAQLQAIRSRVDPLEKLVHALAERLPAPLRYHSGRQHHGFRYGKPDVRHFCLLKAVRAVSALNAAIELARCGYVQEIAVLIRTVIECTTHIEFGLSPGRRRQSGPGGRKVCAGLFCRFRAQRADRFQESSG
jgi:hypothetical protein